MCPSHLTLIRGGNNGFLPSVPPPDYDLLYAHHHLLIERFLQTYVRQFYSVRTLEGDRSFLLSWFLNQIVEDALHPDGCRQLFVWEAMRPIDGLNRLNDYIDGLIARKLKRNTVQEYVGILRRLFEHILENPRICWTAGESPELIAAQYGPLEQPVQLGNYPRHVDEPAAEGYALDDQELDALYDFILHTYIPQQSRKSIALRDYTMIVVAATSGVRANELIHTDLDNLDFTHGLIQVRYGKAARGSGPRQRTTCFTPFAQTVVAAYLQHVRPHFPHAATSPALFLSEHKTSPTPHCSACDSAAARLTYAAANAKLHLIIAAAHGQLKLPLKVTYHDLRRAFTTNFYQTYPDQLPLLQSYMGHSSPNVLHRYIRISLKRRREWHDALFSTMVAGTTRT